MLQTNSQSTFVLAHLLQSGYLDELLLLLATSCSWPAAFSALRVKDELSQEMGALLTVAWAVFLGAAAVAIQFYRPADGMIMIAVGALAGEVARRIKLRLGVTVLVSALVFLMLIGLKY